MKRSVVRWLVVASVGLWLGAGAPVAVSAAGPVVEQAVALHPGWNAVFLEVQPEQQAPAEVFKNLPVASVWAWIPRTSPVQFIQNPGEELALDQGWHVWFPPSAPEKAPLVNLGAILADGAYLVELAGDAPVTLTVRGSIAASRRRWVPNSFNLVGFGIDPAGPPTFGAFFRPSPAHAGQAIFRLGTDGAWAAVNSPDTTPMRPGEAFWIYTKGTSDYGGPLSLRLDIGDALEFPLVAREREFTLRNATGTTRSVVMSVVGATAPVPLSRRRLAPTGERIWPALEEANRVTLEPGAEAPVTLAVRRAEVAAGGTAGVLQITDGEGSLLRVPLAAEAPPLGANGEPSHEGLWLGTVTVNRVTEAQIPARQAFTDPTPAAFEFAFRIILHVDAGGTARLLKEVTQMWRQDTGYVLLTDESLIPAFSPSALVADRPFSYRISTPAFDFAGLQADMSGAFSSDGTLTCTLDVAPSLPTNPFRHRAHPDHDNLDELGYPITIPKLLEAFDVRRVITLAFTGDYDSCGAGPLCGSPTEWLTTRMAGTYRETLTGLHRNPVTVAGTFALRRVSSIAQLNPSAP